MPHPRTKRFLRFLLRHYLWVLVAALTIILLAGVMSDLVSEDIRLVEFSLLSFAAYLAAFLVVAIVIVFGGRWALRRAVGKVSGHRG